MQGIDPICNATCTTERYYDLTGACGAYTAGRGSLGDVVRSLNRALDYAFETNQADGRVYVDLTCNTGRILNLTLTKCILDCAQFEEVGTPMLNILLAVETMGVSLQLRPCEWNATPDLVPFRYDRELLRRARVRVLARMAIEGGSAQTCMRA